MRVHYSRFGYTTRCGKNLWTTRWLTRKWDAVTCRSCQNTRAHR